MYVRIKRWLERLSGHRHHNKLDDNKNNTRSFARIGTARTAEEQLWEKIKLRE